MNVFLLKYQGRVKLLIWILAAIPLTLFIETALSMPAVANPIEYMTHQSGIWALRFLILCLLITPLRRLTGIIALIRFRRAIGLIVFSYAFFHVLVYIIFDHQLSIASILEDIIKRKYILVGTISFFILITLAVTSNSFSVKRLGARVWQRIHRLVYLCALAACIHFIWLTKADYREPLIYTTIIALLLFVRLPFVSAYLDLSKKSVSKK